MAKNLIVYISSLVFFLAVDYIWLAKIAKNFYNERLSHLLLDTPNLGAAAGFYALYVIGIVFFAVSPAMRDGSFATALLNGALFGFFAYATYDMTNYATLRNWPFSVVIVDVLWGAILTGATSLFGFWVSKQI